MRVVFRGRIAGAGSPSGLRVVIGWWPDSPLGSFTDVMVETAAGHRVLLAPTHEVARFVEATYTFDESRIEPVTAEVGATRWQVSSPSLHLELQIGSRTPLGRLLRLVPTRLAARPAWCALTDVVARVVMPGVRTRGSAGNGRREWYGATDALAVTALHGHFEDTVLTELAPVDPPCRFGFSSTPRTPSVTSVVTTIELSEGATL